MKCHWSPEVAALSRAKTLIPAPGEVNRKQAHKPPRTVPSPGPVTTITSSTFCNDERRLSFILLLQFKQAVPRDTSDTAM
jgi:hypothetical protein